MTVNKITKYMHVRLFFHFLPNETCHKKQDFIFKVSCFEPKDGNVFTKLLPYFFPARSGKNLEAIQLYCHI